MAVRLSQRKYIVEKNRIKSVEVDESGNITFYFFGSSEPWDISEFKIGTLTRIYLQEIIDLISDRNELLQQAIVINSAEEA